VLQRHKIASNFWSGGENIFESHWHRESANASSPASILSGREGNHRQSQGNSMTSTRTVLKRLQLTLAAISVAAVLTPLQAQMPSGPGTTGKPAESAASGMDRSNMPMDGKMMGNGGDMMSKMGSMQNQMTAMKPTGNPDIDFALMMRMHHQGAISMAEAELKDGKDPQMKKMATAIIATQKKEIATLDKFLASKGQSAMTMKP
jgi:hypothetical protein